MRRRSSVYIDNKTKVAAAIIGVIILLILLFTLTPLKNVFKSSDVHSKLAEKYIKQARKHLDNQEYDTALERLILAENAKPSRRQKKEIKTLREDIEKARQRNAGVYDPASHIKRLIKEAELAASDEDYDTALTLLDRADKVNKSRPSPDEEVSRQIKKLIDEYTKKQKAQAQSDDPALLVKKARGEAARGNYNTAINYLNRADRANNALRRPSIRLRREIARLKREYEKKRRQAAVNDNPADLVEEAREAASRGNYDSAINLLRRARRANNLSQTPNAALDSEISRLIAQYTKMRQNQARNDDPALLVNRAKQQASKKNYTGALDLLDRARRANNIRQNPDRELAREIERLSKKYRKELARQIRRDNPEALVKRAKKLAANGEYYDAINLLERAKRANNARRRPNKKTGREIERLLKEYKAKLREQARSDNPEELLRRAREAMNRGDYNEANRLIRRSRRANEASGSPNSDLTNRINELERDNATRQAEEARRDDPLKLINEARDEIKKKNYENALKLLRRARKANNAKENPSASINRRINALEAYVKRLLARRARADNPTLLIKQAKGEIARRNYSKARSLLKRARRANDARRTPSVEIAREIDRLLKEIDRLERGDTSGGSGTGGVSRGNNVSIDAGAAGSENAKKRKSKELTLRGKRLLNSGNTDRAISTLEEAVNLDPENSEAHSALGSAYLKKGNKEKALKHATRALSINPNDANSYITRGDVYFKNRQDNQAEVEFQNALNINSNLALALYRLGVINLIKHKNEKALGYFRRAAAARDFSKLSTDDRSKCHYNEGKANERLRRYNASIVAYNKAISYDRNNFKAYISAGQVYYLVRNFNQAIGNLKKSIAIKKTYHGYFWLGKCYEEVRNFSSAIASYKSALSQSPNNYEALFNMGRLYAKLNRHPTAIEYYNKAGNNSSFTSKLYVQMGNSFLALKNYAQAEKAYRLAVSKDSREVEAYKGMARSLEEQTKYSEAVIYLKEGSKLTQHASLFAKLGELYFKLRDYDNAISSFKKALDKSPSNFRYRRLIADVYFAKRDFKTAAGEYEKVIALNSREWIAYHRLGDAYIELRKFEGARTIYKMLLSKNPRYAKAALIRKKLSSLQGVN